MSKNSVVIFASPADWRIGYIGNEGQVVMRAVAPPADATPAQIAESLSAALREAGRPDANAILALPSSWVLSASISTEGLPRVGRHKAMLFRLEDKIPLPVEEVVADFIPDRSTAQGVAVQTTQLAPLITAIEAQGIAIQCICPAALLALQQYLATTPPESPAPGTAAIPGPRAIALGSDDSVDLFILASGPGHRDSGSGSRVQGLGSGVWGRGVGTTAYSLQPTASSAFLGWHHLPADATRIRQLLALHTAQMNCEALSLQTWGLPPKLERELFSSSHVAPVSQQTHGLFELATSAGIAAFAGATAPPMNLRRDALANADRFRQVRQPLHRALAAALFFFAALTLAFLWRGHLYSKVLTTCDTRQRQIFHELFPGRPLPLAVCAYLDSEFRGLQGVSGQSSELPKQTSALLVFYEALRRLPADLRYSLLEVRFEGEEVYFDGQTRSHSDADAIAAALRAQQGFTVEPPRTERLRDEGVGFVLRAKAPPLNVTMPPPPRLAADRRSSVSSPSTQPATQPALPAGPPSSPAPSKSSIAELSK
jgi:hypothetical protein